MPDDDQPAGIPHLFISANTGYKGSRDNRVIFSMEAKVEKQPITFIINGKTFRVRPDSLEALRAIPSADRRELIELLEAVKQQDRLSGDAIDRAAATARAASSATAAPAAPAAATLTAAPAPARVPPAANRTATSAATSATVTATTSQTAAAASSTATPASPTATPTPPPQQATAKPEKLGKGDIDDLMKRLIMEERSKQKPPLKPQTLYFWLGSFTLIFLLLVMAL